MRVRVRFNPHFKAAGQGRLWGSSNLHSDCCLADHTLKSMLVQFAKSASWRKDSYFSAQYLRNAARRGKDSAATAVANSMLIAICHILKDKVSFRYLGVDYFDGFYREHMIHSYLRRLQALEWEPDSSPDAV